MLGHPNLVPTIGFAAPMTALIHLSERWSIFGISTLRYSRGPPTYSNPLNDARTLSTVPLAMDIGVASIVRWKNTGLMVCYRPTRGVVTTKQTSQVTLTPAHILQPKLVAGPRGTGFLPVQPKESVHVHVLLLLLLFA
jgi:hypothetical protein